MREQAIKWFYNLSLDDRLYKTIKHNDLIEGDRTRHPDTLTGREIELIYKKETNKS